MLTEWLDLTVYFHHDSCTQQWENYWNKGNCRNFNYVVWYLFDQLLATMYCLGTNYHYSYKTTNTIWPDVSVSNEIALITPQILQKDWWIGGEQRAVAQGRAWKSNFDVTFQCAPLSELNS